MPTDILQATMENLDPSDLDARIDAIGAANEFLSTYEPGKKVQGLYLYGKFGVGKTYLLGAMANELAQKKISSHARILPEFLREIKSSIQDNSIGEKIDAVKRVQVLMLDDIGAEAMSKLSVVTMYLRELVIPYVRKLTRRSLQSNFDFKELEHHLTYTSGEAEQMKAAYVWNELEYLAKPIPIGGKNSWRHKE